MRTCLTVTLLLWASLAGQAAADAHVTKLVRQAQTAASVQQLGAGQGAGIVILLNDIPAGYSYALWPPAVGLQASAAAVNQDAPGQSSTTSWRPQSPRAP